MTTAVVDCLAHLGDARLAAVPLGPLLQRAAAANVSAIFSGDVDPLRAPPPELTRALSDAEARDGIRVYPLVGLHPQWTREETLDASLRALERTLDASDVIALGEIGLDYRGQSPPRALQRRAFGAQLSLARAHDLPVILHVVSAWGDLWPLLDDHAGVRGVVHGFSGAPEVARELFRRGIGISIGGTVRNPSARKLRATLDHCGPALDGVVVESDAPDHPPPSREWSEPADVVSVVDAIAAHLEVEADQVRQRTTATASRIFSLPKLRRF